MVDSGWWFWSSSQISSGPFQEPLGRRCLVGEGLVGRRDRDRNRDRARKKKRKEGGEWRETETEREKKNALRVSHITASFFVGCF